MDRLRKTRNCATIPEDESQRLKRRAFVINFKYPTTTTTICTMSESTTTGNLRFIVLPADDQPMVFAPTKKSTRPRRLASDRVTTLEEHDATIHDLRGQEAPALDTSIPLSGEARELCAYEEIEPKYYPDSAEQMKRLIGAGRDLFGSSRK
uniref:Uncharacterized protein n=1 Tax=Mycena chlorophos TaxID=658473 RepID=A0ABQ0L377_MYCCL|nr:predicted protein [Mycena chlorophos]